MANPLEDIVPAAYRKPAYAVLALVFLGISLWQAAEGNWLAFAALLTGTLSNGTAAANTHPAAKPVVEWESDADWE